MPRLKLFSVLSFASLVLFALAAAETGEQYTGRVVKIADGDTITVLVGKKQHRVRLEGIDCPERGQAFARKAREWCLERPSRFVAKAKIVTAGTLGMYLLMAAT